MNAKNCGRCYVESELHFGPFGDFFFDFAACAAERIADECEACGHPYLWRLEDMPTCVVCEHCGAVEDDAVGDS